MQLSRRHFARLAGTAALAAPHLTGQKLPTAQEVVDRIQKNVGVPWKPDSLDAIKAGDPSAAITGIATTGMATMDVLTRAVQEKANMVITLEPVFYGRLDGQTPPPPPAGRAQGGRGGGGRGQAGLGADDPVLAAKKEFIEKNGLVLFRFSDHWRARKPDPLIEGFAATMGWTRNRVAGDLTRFDLSEVTIGSLANDLAKKLHARAGIRVVGKPDDRIRHVVLLPGVSALDATMKLLPTCDVVIAGETREWESVEYAQDTVASGQKKGLIMLGRMLSEQPGMSACAEWLKPLVPEVKVSWIPASDPYWRPA
jgi:putative NIF3 family GTP cyclohydrolase 1 type 2